MQLYYCDQPTAKPVHIRRTYTRPDVTEDEFDNLLKKYFPLGLYTATAESLAPASQAEIAECGCLHLDFSRSEVEALKNAMQNGLMRPADGIDATKISQQDALAAYIAKLYSKVLDVNTKKLRIVTNVSWLVGVHVDKEANRFDKYRTQTIDETALHRHPHNVANGLLLVDVSVDTSAPSSQIAKQIRQGIISARDPEFVENSLMMANVAANDATEKGLVFSLIKEGALYVNALLR
jgi:hypothetical protein